jgi:hypothetical protein
MVLANYGMYKTDLLVRHLDMFRMQEQNMIKRVIHCTCLHPTKVNNISSLQPSSRGMATMVVILNTHPAILR